MLGSHVLVRDFRVARGVPVGGACAFRQRMLELETDEDGFGAPAICSRGPRKLNRTPES